AARLARRRRGPAGRRVHRVAGLHVLAVAGGEGQAPAGGPADLPDPGGRRSFRRVLTAPSPDRHRTTPHGSPPGRDRLRRGPFLTPGAGALGLRGDRPPARGRSPHPAGARDADAGDGGASPSAGSGPSAGPGVPRPPHHAPPPLRRSPPAPEATGSPKSRPRQGAVVCSGSVYEALPGTTGGIL